MSRVLPILFNTDMVRAILDERKTVTRRLIKLPKYIKLQDDGLYTLFADGTCYENQHMEELVDYLKPPYQPGDILYVRETWSPVFVVPRRYLYKVGCEEAENLPIKWHPSIHMSKEAARIFLKVKDVRVERLQEITEEQAKTEGAIDNRGFIHSPDNEYDSIHTAKEHFKQIWNSTIKKSDLGRYGWDANPWVWVIEFERCEKLENI